MQLLEIVMPTVALAGAIIVVLLYLYFVQGMFQSTRRTITSMDIPTKLRNIKKLADGGKYGDAITLAYRTFEQMCGSRMSSDRMSSETAREYVERILKILPLDSEVVEQFVEAYEEARFAGQEMARERYEFAIKVFTDLYPRVEGATISPSFE